MFKVPVLKVPNELYPTPVLFEADVDCVKASAPIATFCPPVTDPSNACSPKAKLPATELAPFPIFTELIEPFAEKAGPPTKSNKLK